MKSFEDFLLLVIHVHVIYAAQTISNHQSFDNVTDLAREIISKFTVFQEKWCWTRKLWRQCVPLCHWGTVFRINMAWLLWFYQRGDGDRILRYWKFLLVIFRSTDHYNYAKEAVNLLLHYYYKFSEREKLDLLWNRCINTKGHPGINMPCDLFMEHLNRRLKHSMCANVNPAAIQNAGRAIGPVDHICNVQIVTTTSADNHNIPKCRKYLENILYVFQQEKVCQSIPGRLSSII